MQLLPLHEVASQLTAGGALPWGVRDSSGQLLLARGHSIKDAPMLQALLERGMFVDAVEVRATAAKQEAAAVPAEGFFGLWRRLQARMHTLLNGPLTGDLRTPLEEVIGVLLSLGERDPDKMLFEILRHDGSRHQGYSVFHALHVAAVCLLTSKRLGWAEGDRRSLVGAALTMNLSTVELQGRLAAQDGALTTEQRAHIHAHPGRSAQMLRDGGITDPAWLLAVLQHHEQPDGKGYPTGTTTPSEMAQVLNTVDVFTAKLVGRVTRQAVMPHQAARDLFVARKGHPATAALIKEFGIYPPGCFVKLVSGETGLVVRRGSNANTPIVAVITNRNGDPLAQPFRRDSAHKDYAVVTVVPPANVMVRVAWENLFED